MPFSKMTPAEKVAYVTSELVPMLKNDLRVAVEGGCGKHSVGTTGANFTVVLLCLVACETIGALDTARPTTSWDATREFIKRVGILANDRNYERYAGLLFNMFRNGVGHSFLPKQCTGLRARAVYMVPCVDELSRPAREAFLNNSRRTFHLQLNGTGKNRTFDVATKVLYLDVCRAIDDFADRLGSATPKQLAAFAGAFDRWVKKNATVQGELTPLEKAALDGG